MKIINNLLLENSLFELISRFLAAETIVNVQAYITAVLKLA